MTEPVRNPHAGQPFSDDDDAIAAALADVSIPALLCSLVHMTGDPAWVRGPHQPAYCTSVDFQGGMSETDLAEVRRLALPAIGAFRDAGCVPHALSEDVLAELMEFMARQPVEGTMRGMFLEELQFDGLDARAITWGDEIPEGVRATSPVVVIGAGESGLLAGIRLAQAGLPFTIVEKNAGPGGTWWENRYPGARVDVGSHHYCYSFEPADHWTEYFCQQPELRGYFEGVLAKYQLARHCRFDTEVVEARWDEGRGRWAVRVRTSEGAEETLDARFVISAVGSLNLPKMPAIPGMDSFEGPSFHSARWPDSLDITGSRFALVGAGATGFQIAPTIAERVSHLTIFQRTPQWIIHNPVYHAKVPEGDAWAMRHLPFYGRWFRFIMMYPGIGLGTERYRSDPEYDDGSGWAINESNAGRRALMTEWISSLLEGRPDLIEKSIPNYPAAGKRMLQDNGSWLNCLKRPDVELVRTAIDRVVPDGIVTVDGTFFAADVICYATGFRHNEFLAPMSIFGRNGISLREQWGDEPSAYLGITVPNFPNLFCLYGPGTNLAHGASLFFHSECQMNFTMDAIRQVLASGMRTIEVRKDVHDEYVERHQAEISQLVWSHPSITHSHYKNPAGKIFTLSPWKMETYWDWTRSADMDDFIVTS
ncbi:MAG: NAD(P)/FAD-dependent oxidoreductase [Acidimicrobiales bacterium]